MLLSEDYWGSGGMEKYAERASGAPCSRKCVGMDAYNNP